MLSGTKLRLMIYDHDGTLEYLITGQRRYNLFCEKICSI
jgi:hypothetical protein